MNEINLAVSKGDVHARLGFLAFSEKRIEARGNGRAGQGETFIGLIDDPLQGGQSPDHGVVLGVFLLLGGAELGVDQREERIEICGFGELLNKGQIVAESGVQFAQVVRRNEKKRLLSERTEIAFVENIGEEIGFRFELGGEAFDELPIAIHAFALHDDGQFVLAGKLRLSGA